MNLPSLSACRGPSNEDLLCRHRLCPQTAVDAGTGLQGSVTRSGPIMARYRRLAESGA